jgi:hypothetical protein
LAAMTFLASEFEMDFAMSSGVVLNTMPSMTLRPEASPRSSPLRVEHTLGQDWVRVKLGLGWVRVRLEFKIRDRLGVMVGVRFGVRAKVRIRLWNLGHILAGLVGFGLGWGHAGHARTKVAGITPRTHSKRQVGMCSVVHACVYCCTHGIYAYARTCACETILSRGGRMHATRCRPDRQPYAAVYTLSVWLFRPRIHLE